VKVTEWLDFCDFHTEYSFQWLHIESGDNSVQVKRLNSKTYLVMGDGFNERIVGMDNLITFLDGVLNV
jgi:hypothetical protein